MNYWKRYKEWLKYRKETCYRRWLNAVCIGSPYELYSFWDFMCYSDADLLRRSSERKQKDLKELRDMLQEYDKKYKNKG